MKIGELMTRQVRTCAPESLLTEVAQVMAAVNCGAVPIVTEEKRVVGIVTDRDICIRAVAKGVDIRTAKAADYMTTSVHTCSPETDAHAAAAQMAANQVRRLCVVEGERLAGIVALGDMATVNVHVNEAGDALSAISEPAIPGGH